MKLLLMWNISNGIRLYVPILDLGREIYKMNVGKLKFSLL